MSKYSIAIDFGTTNSVVARWDAAANRPETVCLPGLSIGADGNEGNPHLPSRRPLVPSLLYVQDGRAGRVAAGQAVLEGQLDQQRDNRLFRAFKRGITAGTDLEPRLIDGVPWTDSDAGRHFINCLVSALPFPLEEIEQLVLTVPVAAFEGYVAWLRKAVPPLLAERIRVVDESTAAALGYAVTEPGTIVLVVDFGGGSLDLSLAQLAESEARSGLMGRLMGRGERHSAARVIAKAGVSLGGSDIDQWMLAEVLRRTGLTAAGLGPGYAALLSACEQAKIALSDREQVAIDFCAGDGQAYSVTMQRLELEKLLAANGFYAALRQALDKVMSVAHRRAVYKEDVNQVLMAGGTSLMPSVQGVLQEYFNDHSAQQSRDLSSVPAWPAVQWSGRQTPVRVDKPFTAIVEGALQVAAGYGLDDYLAHSYSLRYLDMQTGQHRYDEIIPMGSRYPTPKPVEVVVGAAHEDQLAVEFVLAQVDTEAVSAVEVHYEGGQAVFVAQADHTARQVILLNTPGATIAPLAGMVRPGRDRLRASFSIDAQRRLRLTVLDLQTRQELLSQVVVAALEDEELAAVKPGKITGLEPCLPAAAAAPGRYHLSLRGLSTMLNLLPPEAVSLEALTEALRSPDYAVRYNAAEMLSRRGDRDARRIFEDVFARGESLLRASAAQHLHRFSWLAAEPLYRLALADAELRVREAAVLSLCKLRTHHAYNLLVEALPQAGDVLLLAAAWGLSNTPDSSAIPVLAITLQSQDPEARDISLEALGQMRTKDALPVVRQALDDPDLDVKYSAVLSLVELAEAEALPELAERIHQAQGWPRQRILCGLFHATNYLQIDIGATPAAEAVITALEAALLDELPAARIAAAMPLAWMRVPRAAQVLSAAYARERDSDAKANMLNAAVALMSPAAEALLQDGLQSPDRLVRQTADYLASTRKQ